MANHLAPTRLISSICGAALLTLSLMPANTAIGATTYERISVSAIRKPGNANAATPATSTDGKYVAFASDASDLVAGDTNATKDIFLRNRLTGATTRVNVSSSGVQSDGMSASPSITPDGRYVAFSSYATNLDPAGYGIYLKDLQTGSLRWVAAGGNSSLAADARAMAYHSYDFTDGTYEQMVYIDLTTGMKQTLSVDAAGQPGINRCSYTVGSPGEVKITPDGHYAVFDACYDNLMPGDSNGAGDVYVRDIQAGTTELISKTASGVSANAPSGQARISADGRYVVFISDATDLVSATAGSGEWDRVYEYDRSTGTIRLISDPTCTCHNVDISADGRYISWSGSGSLGYVWDRVTGTTINITSGDWVAISGDGKSVFFVVPMALTADDKNKIWDVYVANQ